MTTGCCWALLPEDNDDRIRPRLALRCRTNRDRGKPHGFSPPTPPDMRVRIRRFGGLSYRGPVNLGIPSESK